MSELPKKARILIVDDEVAVANSLALIFSSQGYEAREAYGAEQAIELIAVWKPDVAITDVMLPGMNGIQLAEVLNANYPECAVLLVSGHPGTEDLMNTAMGRALLHEILPKPLHPALLLEKVAGLMPPAGHKADVPRLVNLDGRACEG